MLSPIDLNIAQKLNDPEYRHEFYISRTQNEIATQIRELRDYRKLTQSQLAQSCEMKQSAVSRLEDADYSGWSFKTLSRIAKALDARLQILFVPMEKVMEEYQAAKTNLVGFSKVIAGELATNWVNNHGMAAFALPAPVEQLPFGGQFNQTPNMNNPFGKSK